MVEKSLLPEAQKYAFVTIFPSAEFFVFCFLMQNYCFLFTQ